MKIRRGYTLRPLKRWRGGARWTWNAGLDSRVTLDRQGHAKAVSGTEASRT